jgi:hypothetical protein
MWSTPGMGHPQRGNTMVMKFLRLFETDELVNFDELPEETKRDISYYIVHLANLDSFKQVPQDAWGHGADVDEQDVYDVLNGSWPQIRLRVQLLDLKKITGYDRQTSKRAVDKYVKMLHNGSIPPPILVDGWKNGHYEFLDGGHRMQAALNSGQPTIPAVDIGSLLRMNWVAFMTNDNTDHSLPIAR